LVLCLADGQAIAIKLSGQINKVVKNMNKSLISLNAKTEASAKPLSFNDIKDSNGDVYKDLQTAESISIPGSTRAKLIELYCLKERCSEEVEMIKEEMARLEAFYNNEIETIETLCNNMEINSNPLNDGIRNTLMSNRTFLCFQLKSMETGWKDIYTMKCTSEDRLILPYEQYLGANPFFEPIYIHIILRKTMSQNMSRQD
jgi:hypothetical protein